MIKTIAVDLDGTLAFYHGWNGINDIGEPIQSCIDLLKALKNDGWRIVINTCRLNGLRSDTNYELGYKSLVNWLTKHDVPYDKIATQLDGKILANVYLDDRGINWKKNMDDLNYSASIYHEIKRMMGYQNE